MYSCMDVEHGKHGTGICIFMYTCMHATESAGAIEQSTNMNACMHVSMYENAYATWHVNGIYTLICISIYG